MIARDYSGTIETYNRLPKKICFSYGSKERTAINSLKKTKKMSYIIYDKLLRSEFYEDVSGKNKLQKLRVKK